MRTDQVARRAQVDRTCRCLSLGRLVTRAGAMIFAVVTRFICQTLLARCRLDKGGSPMEIANLGEADGLLRAA
jgi:hypothetical protein